MSNTAENPLRAGYEYIQLVRQDHPDFERVIEESPGIHPFDIEDALDSPHYGDKVRKHGYFHSLEQKVHAPEQIVNVEQITPGMRIAIWHINEVIGIVESTSEPYQDREGNWLVDCIGMKNDQECELFFLASCGVVPDKRGYWNTWNWLEPLPEDEYVQSLFDNFLEKSNHQ